MKTRVSLLLGVAAGGTLLYREHRGKVAMERFAAAALETLLNAIEANDEETGLHVRRVAACARILAEAAGLSEHECRAVERVGLYHDIGKIHEALFDIVHEPRRLSPAERRAIATHPARGAEVLGPLSGFYPELPEGVLSHHERWDGKGYPRRLKGKRIPLEARIVAIADTFDAVTNSRRYRRGAGIDQAVEVLQAGRGTQWDPELIDLALFPPVLAAMSRVRISGGGRSSAERHRNHKRVPDVAFRWRSESLGSRRVSASRKVE